MGQAASQKVKDKIRDQPVRKVVSALIEPDTDADCNNETSEETTSQNLSQTRKETAEQVSGEDQSEVESAVQSFKPEDFNEEEHHQMAMDTTVLQIYKARSVHHGPVYNIYQQQSSNQNISNSTDTDLRASVQNLKQKLKGLYKDVTLPMVSWLNEGADFQLKDYYADLQLDVTGEKIELEEIFQDSEDKMKRIFIEGQPGIGKTTLLAKLAYDWATDVEYMQKFDLVFVILLREMQEEDIKNTLINITKECGCNDTEQLEDMVQESKNKALILLDGLDELRHGKMKESVYEALFRKVFCDATVVVTCRSGMFELDQDRLKQLNRFFHRKKEFWDKKINVLGIDLQGAQGLLSKFLTESQTAEMIEKIQSSNQFLHDLCKSPLIVILLGFLYGTEEITDWQMTRTVIYEKISNGLLRYSLAKLNKYEEKFELQLIHTSPMLNCFMEFGKQCLQQLIESKFQFEKSAITEKMYEIGFLTKTEWKSHFRRISYFEAFHRSFLEFYAAFFIWQEYKASKGQCFSRKIVDLLNNTFFETRGTSLVLPFLVGMLGDDAYILFNQLAGQAQVYCRFRNGMWNILEECKDTELNIQATLPLLPVIISCYSKLLNNFSFVKSGFVKSVIKMANEESKVSVLGFYGYGEVCNLPEDVSFKRIILKLNGSCFSDESVAKISSAFHKVFCEDLFMEVFGEVEITKDKQEIVRNWMEFLRSLKYENFLMYATHPSILQLLLACLGKEPLHPSIHVALVCDISGGNDWTEVITSLLEHEILDDLTIYVSNPGLVNMKEVSLGAAKSKRLSSLKIIVIYEENEHCDGAADRIVDMNDLTANGEKSFDAIHFWKVESVNSLAVDQELKVNDFAIWEHNLNVIPNVLISHITILHCSSTFLFNLREEVETYTSPIFSSLKEVKFMSDEYYEESDFWKHLTRFRGLENLYLWFSTTPFSPNDFIAAILQMDLRYVEFGFRATQSQSVCEGIALLSESLRSGCQMSLKQIGLQICEQENEEYTKKILSYCLELLEEGILTQVDVYSGNEVEAGEQSLIWVDEDKFIMTHDIAGRKKEKMSFWKTKFNNGEICDKVTIRCRKNPQLAKNCSNLL